MSANGVDLKTLKEQLDKKKEEIIEAEKEYKLAMYGADAVLIKNAMLDKCLDSLETFGGMTVTDKKKIAEMFAEKYAKTFSTTFTDFFQSDEVQTVLAESQAKRDRLKKRREEKKAAMMQERVYNDDNDDYELNREATFEEPDPYTNSGQSYQ